LKSLYRFPFVHQQSLPTGQKPRADVARIPQDIILSLFAAANYSPYPQDSVPSCSVQSLLTSG